MEHETKFEKVTLQFTREGTYWPDVEEGEMSEGTIYVTRSQKEQAGEYDVLARDEKTGVITELRAEDGEEFFLSFNPALSRYYVRSKHPDRPFKTPMSMTGHRVIYHEPSKTAIWVIPRNGSCTVLASVLHAKGKSISLEQPARIWGCEGVEEVSEVEREDTLLDPEKWNGYRHCLVYQDPELRCIRHMNYILSVNRAELHTFFSDDPLTMGNVDTFMDTYLTVAEINARNTKGCYEHYMMPQLFFHRTLPVIPEVIIELGDLEAFIRTEMGIEPKRANVENSISFPISKYTKERQERVERIYGEDRVIETRFKDRLWKPRQS